MLFNSFAFLLVFLPAALAIYILAERRPELRVPTLIALSFAFYGYWDIRFVPLLAASILVNWLAAQYFLASRRPSVITWAIVANLLVLGLFKYWNFAADNVNVLGLQTARLDLALPLGISFFTFHHVMYLVDLRRGIAPRIPLGKYALYICFFPQVLAGPLVRWSEIVDQFGAAMFRPGWEKRWVAGIAFIVLGLLQKTMLADPLGAIVNPIYAAAEKGPISTEQAWMATAFSFQVFFDFAGYTDIAIGLALLLGIQLPRNFDAPFRTTSMVDFWQRWHMTLARFLRDYVYVPLSRVPIGGGRHRMTRALVAILLTMGLCGLWHGAGWTFLVWGVLQGVGIVFAAVWARKMPSPPAIVGWAGTVGFFIITIVFFRATSFEAAGRIYHAMLGVPAFAPQGWRTLAIAAFCAIVLPASHVMVARITEKPRPAVSAGLAVASVLALLQIARIGNYEFVYFQF